jgi:phosphoglycerol transferase
MVGACQTARSLTARASIHIVFVENKIGTINTMARTQTARRHQWVTPTLAGVISVCVVWVRLGLWHYDLAVPITYSGDALYETVLVKALTESFWNYHILRLGAPFGMDAVDFPIGCGLDFGIIKLMSFIVHNPCLLINLYWLLAISLAGAFATLLLRYLDLRPIWALTAGVLYAIIPFTFLRNISHLNLVHFIVPGAAYLGLSLARGESLQLLYRPLGARSLIKLESIWKLVICLAIGLTYIYWAFFACITVAVGAVIGLIRSRSKAVLVAAIIYGAVIGAGVIVDNAASLLYWRQHGRNSALDYKRAAEADIFGLRIRQMLTPILKHPLTVMRGVRRKILSANFPNDNNESATATLGAIGSLGFLLLVIVAVVQPKNTALADPRMQLFSAFVIAFVLIAEVGGFGSLFNVFVMHQFRAYNRVSPFISLFSLAAVAVTLDHLCHQKPGYLQLCVAGVILLAGSFDQIPVAFFRYHRGEEEQFYNDRQFIRKLEPRLSPGAMIFQLPNTGFPPDGKHERMQAYDNARAYLQSKTLRWSWGAMDGRHGDWAKTTAALPIPEMLERLVFAGFAGVLLDRFGYPDAATEQQIATRLDPTSRFDTGARWVFFDLRPLYSNLVRGLSPSEIAKRRQIAIDPIGIE